MRRVRAFTLVEMMVASTMAFIMVAAAAELAAAMARHVKRTEEQADLGMRASVGHAYLSSLLSGVAYNWNVTHAVTATTTSGSLGEGACALSSGMCAATGQMRPPLRICNGATVTASTCAAPTTTTSDALWTYVPRDDLIEAVTIIDRNTTPLTTACTAANVPASVDLDVRGQNASAWASGDLVLVSTRAHATIGTLTAAFASDVNPATTRTLSIDVGSGTNLVNDDGFSGTACDATVSLKNAKVIRIRQIVIKQDPATRRLLLGHRDTGAGALVFDTLLSDVDDFQVQLDLAHFTSTLGVPSAPAICTSNTSDILGTGVAALTNITGGACNGQRLNGNIADTHVNRVVGLRVGVLLRTAVETQAATFTTPALFDRTTTFTDKRLRRASILYVGLPNAANL